MSRTPTEIDRLAHASKRPWTEPEDDIIHDHYGAETARTIQSRIYRELGSARSQNAIAIRASRVLGLDHRTAQGYYTAALAADELGVDRHLLYHHISSGKIKTKGRGKCKFIPDDEMARLRVIFPIVTGPTMSKTEAMRALGYSETHLTRLLKAGAIRATKRGDRWRVDAHHVADLVREFKRTGKVRKEWPDLPGIIENRQRVREYMRRRREVSA